MLNQFAQLKSADISPANFENSCQTLSAAADTLGLTPNDKTVVMWASFLTGNNMRRDEIRKTLCVSSWSQSFEILGLVLPPVIAPPSLPVNNAELSETRLRSLMASYFSVLGKETDQELKTLALMALLLDRPKPDFNIDPDFGLALMDESASPRELAEKLAGLTFRAGCFFRAADKTVHYLIRKLSAGSENGEHLWVGDARLVSALSPATIDSTKLTELRFKNATANDLVEFAQNFPERQGCSNVSTAPTIN
jgi:hypothetical protein